MNQNFYEELFALDDDTRVEKIFDNNTDVIWIDWREEETSIVDYVNNSVVDVDIISVILTTDDEKYGYEVKVCIGNTCKTVSPLSEESNQHQILRVLDELLDNTYEIRFVTDSNGSDTLAVIVESIADWKTLEEKFGSKIKSLFIPISECSDIFNTPNLEFTPNPGPFKIIDASTGTERPLNDILNDFTGPQINQSQIESVVLESKKKPWWKFW